MSGTASQVCIVAGLAMIGVGLVTANARVRRLSRVHRKSGLIHPAMPDGWGQWFFQGFSHVTIGTRWVVTMAWLSFCVVVGVGLISIGW